MLTKFCSLCGVVLVAVNDDHPSPGALPWFQEVRAVRSMQGTSSPSLTGVGFLNSSRKWLVAHPDETIRYSDPAEGFETYPLRHESKQFWVFPFHDACWGFLLARVSDDSKYSTSRVTRHLFNIFYCTPWDGFETLTPGHDYGGAAQFQFPSSSLHNIRDSGHWSYLAADPNETFPMAWLPSLTEPASSIETSTRSDLEQSDPVDVFLCLPIEVVTLVLSYLPSVDVCNFRLSSRTVARISQPDMLPQHFWASRFQSAFEMGFVFVGQYPFDRGLHPDWRRMYLTAKSALRDVRSRPGFVNRRRIWHVLGHISEVLVLLLAQESTHGIRLARDDSVLRSANGASAIHHRYGPVVSAELFPEHDPSEQLPVLCAEPPVFCRKLEAKSLLWPSTSSSGDLHIGVSFIWFNTRFYVAGLRVRSTSTSDCGSDGGAVGRIIPSTEKLIVLEHPDRLEGIEVAVTAPGIVGLKFLIESADVRFSRIVGDVETVSPDVGVGRLYMHHHRRLVAITAGFDVCKLVSLQLIESDLSEVVLDSQRTSTTASADGLQSGGIAAAIRERIWTPGFPSSISTLRPVPELSTDQVFNRYLNMDFGGAAGCFLASLQRIVAIMFGYPAVFLGFDFVYDNGRHSFYGTRTVVDDMRREEKGIEVSFPIDGAKGERISGIVVECHAKSDFVQSIQIGTNWGNHKVFWLIGGLGPRELPTRYALKPPHEEVITGFFAQLEVSNNSFKTFGIQSQAVRCGKPPLCNPLIADKPCVLRNVPDIGGYIITYRNRGRVYTTARLQGVRRVRISSGAPGHCRTSQHISGIWFEYHDSNKQCIAGQWITELDSWEISLDEKITEISLWCSNERTNTGWSRTKQGKVTGVSIKTSSGRTRRFEMSPSEEHVCLRYRRNRFEELGSIIWAFNSNWDHARVIYTPSPVPDVPSPIFTAFDLPWQVPEKFLWQDTDLDGAPCRVTSIEMSSVCGAITSISFIYTSGITLTLGSREGETCIMHMATEEELVRLGINYGSFRAIEIISFYTNRGREVTQNASRPLEPWEQAQGRLRPQTPNVIFNLHPSSKDLPTPSGCNIHEIPPGAGPFVGLWGIAARRGKRIKQLGPVFMGLPEWKGGLEMKRVTGPPIIQPADGVGFDQSGFEVVPIIQENTAQPDVMPPVAPSPPVPPVR